MVNSETYETAQKHWQQHFSKMKKKSSLSSIKYRSDCKTNIDVKQTSIDEIDAFFFSPEVGYTFSTLS